MKNHNHICLNCKKVFSEEPIKCDNCNGKTFHKTEAEVSKSSEAIRITNPEWTEDKVKSLIHSIYSEFAELHRSMQGTHSLRRIIEQELENHPTLPIQIFKK